MDFEFMWAIQEEMVMWIIVKRNIDKSFLAIG